MFFTSKADITASLKDYQLGLGRPFRSLKLYTTLRRLGLEGLRCMMRRHIALAKYAADELLRRCDYLRVHRVAFGLVC